jgi:hypothetical protein
MKNKEKIIALVSILLWVSCLQGMFQNHYVKAKPWQFSVQYSRPQNFAPKSFSLEKIDFNQPAQKTLKAAPDKMSAVQASQAAQPVETYSGGVARTIFGKPLQPQFKSLEYLPITSNSTLKDILVPRVKIKKTTDQQSLDLARDTTSNASSKNAIVVSPEQLRSYLQSMPQQDLGPFVDMLLQQPAEKGPIVVWNADMSKSLKISRDVAAEALRLVENAPVQQQDQSMDLVPVVKQSNGIIDRDIQVVSEGPLRQSSLQKARSGKLATDVAVEKIEQAATPAARIGILTAIKNSFLRMLGFKVEDLSSGQSNAVNSIIAESENQIEAVENSTQPAAVKQRKYSDIIANMLQAIKNLFVAKPVDLPAE